MPERDHVGAQAARDLINGAAPEAAAQIASVIGLFVEQPERRIVAMVSPVDAARFQIFAEGFDGAEKLPLLDGEGANGELDRCPLLQRTRISSSVTESLPPDKAAATRSPSRIILKR